MDQTQELTGLPAEVDVLETTAAGGAAVRGGALRVAGYLLTAGVGAASAAVVFRHLGVNGTGSYVTVLSLVAIVGGMSDLGLSALGLRELAVRDVVGRRELMRTLVALRIEVTAIGVGVAVLFALIANYRAPLVAGVAVAGAGLFVQNLQATLAFDLLRNLKFGWVTVIEVGRQVALALIVIGLALAGAGIVPILAASIPCALASLLWTVALVRRNVSLRPTFSKATQLALLRDLLPVAIAVATAALYFRVSVVVVSLVSSGRQLGYFSASFRIIEVLTLIPAMMVGTAFPIFVRAARDDHVRFAYGVERVFEVALIVGLLFVLLLGVGAPVAIGVVGGAKFHPAVVVLRIQSLGLGGSFVSAVWGYALLSLRKQRELIIISVGALLGGVALTATLGSVAGAEGAAVATAAAELALAVVGGLVLGRRHPHLVPSLTRVPRIVLAAVCGAAVALIPGTPAVGLMGLAAVLYVALLCALHAVPEEITQELLRWRGRLRVTWAR